MKLFRSKTPKGRKILLVDDDPQITTLLTLFLQKDYKDMVIVIGAASGNEGVAKAQATVPDLIIIEIAMSEQNGYAICKQLKAVLALQQIPILFVGTKSPLEIYSEVHDLGAQGYLTYPFFPDELKKARDMLLKGDTYWPPLHDPWLLFDQSK